ncbi:MAG: hypothetical protein KBT21_09240 [Treponema sp.]|nr:hypothetical protein [Candidatus Treponema merdequi]
MEFTKKAHIILISVITALLLTTAAIITHFIRTNTTQIAFYQLTPEIQKAIEDQITKSLADKKSRVHFTTLSETKPLFEQNTKKYAVIFSYNSRSIIELNSKQIPVSIMQAFPTKIRYSVISNNKFYAMPVLLDHFGFSIYTSYQNMLNLAEPKSLTNLKQFLTDINTKASVPLAVCGADDTELFGFVSSYAQSMMTINEYFALCSELNKAQSTLSDLPYELKKVLDEIKSLQKIGLLFAKWTTLTQSQMEFLMKEHHMGSAVTSLSLHRTFPYVLNKYYNITMFPQEQKETAAIIAPEIVAVKMKNGNFINSILQNLSTPDSQKELSKNTMLAPAASTGESHDTLADDVRFWSAATPSGPVPSLKEASFITPDRVKLYADKIREYLK